MKLHGCCMIFIILLYLENSRFNLSISHNTSISVQSITETGVVFNFSVKIVLRYSALGFTVDIFMLSPNTPALSLFLAWDPLLLSPFILPPIVWWFSSRPLTHGTAPLPFLHHFGHELLYGLVVSRYALDAPRAQAWMRACQLRAVRNQQLVWCSLFCPRRAPPICCWTQSLCLNSSHDGQ